MFRILKRAPWIAAGALGAWLLDGAQGQARRRRLRERVDALLSPTPVKHTPVDVEVPEGRAA